MELVSIDKTSNTQESVSPHFQLPRSSFKILHVVISNWWNTSLPLYLLLTTNEQIVLKFKLNWNELSRTRHEKFQFLEFIHCKRRWTARIYKVMSLLLCDITLNDFELVRFGFYVRQSFVDSRDFRSFCRIYRTQSRDIISYLHRLLRWVCNLKYSPRRRV